MVILDTHTYWQMNVIFPISDLEINNVLLLLVSIHNTQLINHVCLCKRGPYHSSVWPASGRGPGAPYPCDPDPSGATLSEEEEEEEEEECESQSSQKGAEDRPRAKLPWR